MWRAMCEQLCTCVCLAGAMMCRGRVMEAGPQPGAQNCRPRGARHPKGLSKTLRIMQDDRLAEVVVVT